MVKACPHHGIVKCILMEMFYFGLTKDTQQSIDILFVRGMLTSSYNS